MTLKSIELIICARCEQEIEAGGMCGYNCDLDGELRDARNPSDVITECYTLASSRKWSESRPSPEAAKEPRNEQ